MHVCVSQVCLVSVEAIKRMPDPLELELQMVMSCHVGARNQKEVIAYILREEKRVSLWHPCFSDRTGS